MTAEEQEALSRKYSDDVILLLPLSTGSIAVFNNSRTLCGIIPPSIFSPSDLNVLTQVWRKSQIVQQVFRVRQSGGLTLDDLGL